MVISWLRMIHGDFMVHEYFKYVYNLPSADLRRAHAEHGDGQGARLHGRRQAGLEQADECCEFEN